MNVSIVTNAAKFQDISIVDGTHNFFLQEKLQYLLFQNFVYLSFRSNSVEKSRETKLSPSMHSLLKKGTSALPLRFYQSMDFILSGSEVSYVPKT